jgi:hypothetical protein
MFWKYSMFIRSLCLIYVSSDFAQLCIFEWSSAGEGWLWMIYADSLRKVASSLRDASAKGMLNSSFLRPTAAGRA